MTRSASGKVAPTIPIGTSTQAGAFTEQIVKSMAARIDRPVAPRYSALDALHEALTWLVAHGQVDVHSQPL